MFIIFREILKKNFFSPITSPITARVLTSNLSAILTLKSRLHKKVFPVTWQAAVRMDHFRYIKIQNEIKQKNVLFIAEPQDNLFCFISPSLAYLRTQKFHSEAIISSGFDTELQYTRLFHNFFLLNANRQVRKKDTMSKERRNRKHVMIYIRTSC